MTYEEARKEAEQILKGAEVPDAALDAWYLLEYAIQKIEKKETGRTWYLMNRKESILPGTLSYYQELVYRRKQRIPLQHLTGEQEFYGYPFYVNEHVLIPRQDTEVLVEEALKRKKEGMKVLDLCTGSGCIAISLAKLGGYTDVTALDLSEEALKVARSNGEKLLDQPVKFIKSDMFSALNPEKQYNVIVSNPPYIPSQVIEGLEPEVKDHEPRMALDGEPDGLKFYRILAEEGKKYLKNGGSIYMEIGWDQAKDVTEIFEAMGFSGLRTVRDMAGNDRVVCARKEK